MKNNIDQSQNLNFYEIRVSGYVDPLNSDILGGMSISASKEESILRGSLIDQSELNGVINSLVNGRHTILSIITKDIQQIKKGNL